MTYNDMELSLAWGYIIVFWRSKGTIPSDHEMISRPAGLSVNGITIIQWRMTSVYTDTTALIMFAYLLLYQIYEHTVENLRIDLLLWAHEP